MVMHICNCFAAVFFVMFFFSFAPPYKLESCYLISGASFDVRYTIYDVSSVNRKHNIMQTANYVVESILFLQLSHTMPNARWNRIFLCVAAVQAAISYFLLLLSIYDLIIAHNFVRQLESVSIHTTANDVYCIYLDIDRLGREHMGAIKCRCSIYLSIYRVIQ